MPLSIFIDALPYDEIVAHYNNWFDNMQVAELIPNIAYSSSLHWQLYCNKYPDERGVMVDWVKESESNKAVRFFSFLLRPFDKFGRFGELIKKGLDRVIFRSNTFANIPFEFRKDFCEKGQYLFWDKSVYQKEDIFAGYTGVSQDEGHISFDETLLKLSNAIDNGNKKIFVVFGFADSIGHQCRRGEIYSQKLAPYMDSLKKSIRKYREKYPTEEIIIASDHGMSTINNYIDLGLEQRFGKQSRRNYIAYSDSAVMCIWTEQSDLKEKISHYLEGRTEGHLLTESEREKYKVTDKKFGDIIYNLREGNVFKNNWFGKSFKKPNSEGSGMHGFWPEWEAKDQMACIILIGSNKKIQDRYEYPTAYQVICNVMNGEEK